MPHCPSCNRVFSDQTQSFCLNDGARLVPDGSGYDPQKTMLSPPPRNTAPTPPQPTTNQAPRNVMPPAGQYPGPWAPPPQGWPGYYPPPMPYPPRGAGYVPQPSQPVSAILSLIFGCVATIFCLLMPGVIVWLGVMLAIAGVILAIAALTKVSSKGLAMSGVASSSLALIIFLARLMA